MILCQYDWVEIQEPILSTHWLSAAYPAAP